MKLFKNKWFWIGAGVVVTLIALVGAIQARKARPRASPSPRRASRTS